MKTIQALLYRRAAWMAALALSVAATLFLVALALPAASHSRAIVAREALETTKAVEIASTGLYTVHLPLLPKDPPTPQIVADVPLPGIQCPYAVDVNPVSRYVYIANHDSGSVSILSGTTRLATIPTGAWPTSIASDPHSNRTYVTNLQAQNVSVFEGLSQITKFATFHEPYGLAVNPVNGYLYVTNPFVSRVQIVSNTTTVTTLHFSDGWVIAVAADPRTGLTYAAGWEHGRMFVLSGTQSIAAFDVGWGPNAIAIDPNSGYVYVANRKNGTTNTHYPHNLAIISGTQVIQTFTTSGGSTDVAVDPNTGYVYATDEKNNTVTVLRGTELVGVLPVGQQPWAVAVNPNTGYAFVANRRSNTVTVLRHGYLVTTLAVGREPFDVAVDTASDHVYVVNRAIEEWIDENDVGHYICHPTSITVLR